MTEKDPRELAELSLHDIQQEFVSAAALQRHIMPDPERLTVFGDYDILGRTFPTAVLGGDFYDFIDLDRRFGMKDRMGIVIADAAGHGLVSAMLIRDFNTALYTAISFQSHYERDTTPLLFKKINRRMFRSSQPSQFISAFYGELTLQGRLRYVNCGHYPSLLLKGDVVHCLDTGGTVLGAFRDPPSEYHVGEEYLDSGDILICYTDGVIETADELGQEYGLERLQKLVQAHRHLGSREIIEEISADLERYSVGVPQADDRTLIVIRKG